MQQVMKGFSPEEFFVTDGTKKVAIVRRVEVGGRSLWRSVTWHSDSSQRELLGYFPYDNGGFRLAVECTWSEWVKHNPPTSNRR